jgi:uncharacterized protein YndB with AHSA1/START domain
MTKRVVEEAVITGLHEEVWPLVTDARHFRAWYAFGGADSDLRPGGLTALRWDEHGTFHAVVESVVPESLFSFRWRPDPGPLVDITLHKVGSRATRVQIVESGGLEDPEQSALAWRTD